MDRKYIKKIDDSINVVITKEDLKQDVLKKTAGVCVVDEPRQVFYEVHNYISKKPECQRKSFKTIIGRNCVISPNVTIPDMNVVIGDRVVIEERVSLIGHVSIGEDSIIHTGTVIGTQGNDFKSFGGKLIRTAQIGGVKIGKGVEIDQNCCIERPAFSYEDTVLGDETKLGALSFVAHGVRIGERTQIKGMVNIGGYTNIGSDVFIGPGATISNLISIGDSVHVTIGAVVASSVLPGSHVTGNFAIEHEKFMYQQLRMLRD